MEDKITQLENKLDEINLTFRTIQKFMTEMQINHNQIQVATKNRQHRKFPDSKSVDTQIAKNQMEIDKFNKELNKYVVLLSQYKQINLTP